MGPDLFGIAALRNVTHGPSPRLRTTPSTRPVRCGTTDTPGMVAVGPGPDGYGVTCEKARPAGDPSLALTALSLFVASPLDDMLYAALFGAAVSGAAR